MTQAKESSSKPEFPFYVAPEIVSQLLKGKEKVMKYDQDRLYIITGREGLGKSTLAAQLAYVVDPLVDLDSFVFTSEEFEKRIKTIDKFRAVIFDEAFNGLSSKGAISNENKRLIKLLMECRQKNLFVFIVLPTIFLLERYVALFRSTALFNVLSSKKDFGRRYYKVYNYSDKGKLFKWGRTLLDYSRPHIPFSYRFFSKLPPTINREEYKAKKLAAFIGNEDEVKDEETKAMKQRNFLLNYINKEFHVKYTEISRKMESANVKLDSAVIARISKEVAKNNA